MNLQFLIDSIKESPIINKNGYNYFVHALTDGALPIDPEILFKTARRLQELIERDVTHSNLDFIIAPEAMALPIATVVSTLMDRPYVVARKRKYGLPGELEVHQQTGYSESTMYINSIKPGRNVIIIDDVVSTGGTISVIVDTLESNHINVIGSYTIIEKDGAAERLRDQGYNVKSLVNVIMGTNSIETILVSNKKEINNHVRTLS